MCFCHCHITAESKIIFLVCIGSHLFALFAVVLLSFITQFSSTEIQVVPILIIFHFVAIINCILILFQIKRSNPNKFFKEFCSFFIFYFYSVINAVFIALCIFISVSLNITFVIFSILLPSIFSFIVVLINISYFIFLFTKKEEINLCNYCRIHCDNSNHVISSSLPDNLPAYEMIDKPPLYNEIDSL